jgi:hypothetical protein
MRLPTVERACVHRVGKRDGRRVGVHTHGIELGSKRLFEACGEIGWQRLTVSRVL